MTKPPRNPQEPLFSSAMIVWGLLQGVLAFGLVSTIFVLALNRGMPIDEVRALSFFSLVIAIIALILVNRSTSASLAKAFKRPNQALSMILPGIFAILAVTLLVPTVRELFKFGPLHWNDLLLTLGVGCVMLVTLELLKPAWRAVFAGSRFAGLPAKI